MASEFKLPPLGDNIEEAQVVSVMVAEGDDVAVEHEIIEVETDKAVTPVPVDVAGRITKIHIGEGDTVKPGDLIATIESNGAPGNESAAPAEDTAPAAPAPSGDAVEFGLPFMGDGIDEAQVVSVMVSVGDAVDVEAEIVEVETDKAVTPVPIDVAGTIQAIHVGEGDTVKPGTPLVTITPGSGAAGKAASQPATATPTPAPAAPAATPSAPAAPAQPQSPPAQVSVASGAPDGGPVFAAPNVRKFAREVGVDITRVTGTGPGGRITQDDVKARARTQPAAAAGGGGVSIADAPLPDFTGQGEVEATKMSMIAKKTAEHMALCWATIPHVTLHDTVDVTDLEEFRQSQRKRVEKAGGKLTVTAILVKLITSALKEFPIVNASIDTANQQIIYKKYYHIGVAADTPRGLVVPVIRDADQQSLTNVSVQLGEMAAKARDGKLAIEDMQGATFTITNLGGMGIGHFTPIVNHPEAAILGVGRAVPTPVYVDGQLQQRLMMPLSLSFDHRLVNGADGARFMQWLKRAVEQPLSVLIDA